MGCLKFSSFLALSMLVLYQAGLLQASAFSLHPASLSEEKGDLPVGTPMKDHEKRMAREQEQEQEQWSATAQKRDCKLATCTTGNLMDYLHKIANKGEETSNSEDIKEKGR
ncbi:calcitonin gene-related peptide 2-like [Saccopteryx bilineata]|uniref:calcitonin gene-related peptide 2-like n=1 Tax=Saccopteryx bilineata TaxID=59482 RepID=UPI0033904615